MTTQNTGGTAADVLALCEERGVTLAVAESLTGGLLAAEITAVPGASQAFRGAVVAYATDLKRDVLGVDSSLLAQRGAVDGEVARQMAAGVRWRLGADWAVATTGVAGPDPQDGQQPGTVFVAVAGPEGRSETRSLNLAGSRQEIRTAAVGEALALLRRHLDAAPKGQDGRKYPENPDQEAPYSSLGER